MKKKMIGLVAVVCFAFANPMLSIAETVDSANTEITAQVADTNAADSAVVENDTAKAIAPVVAEETPKEEEVVTPSFQEVIKNKIVEGGVLFMSIVLLCLVFGLIIALERIITLNLASTNVRKLLVKVKDKLDNGGITAAQEFCASTRGPVAGIYSQALMRAEEGVDAVKTAVDDYGSAQMGKLEKGMSWLSLFLSLAPMFGFMGTILGMIESFDKIQAANDMQIGDIAGGIKVALLTTVGGLIVAVILQIFFNYLTSLIDKLSEQMEDGSNDFMDILIKGKYLK